MWCQWELASDLLMGKFYSVPSNIGGGGERSGTESQIIIWKLDSSALPSYKLWYLPELLECRKLCVYMCVNSAYFSCLCLESFPSLHFAVEIKTIASVPTQLGEGKQLFLCSLLQCKH